MRGVAWTDKTWCDSRTCASRIDAFASTQEICETATAQAAILLLFLISTSNRTVQSKMMQLKFIIDSAGYYGISWYAGYP
jgi:hypothetical protein